MFGIVESGMKFTHLVRQLTVVFGRLLLGSHLGDLGGSLRLDPVEFVGQLVTSTVQLLSVDFGHLATVLKIARLAR